MAYNDLLKDMISKAGLTQYAIWKGCNELGVPVDRSLINKLYNEPERRAGDEINRAICKVCSVPEDWLTTQARLDKDSETLKKASANFTRVLASVINRIFNPDNSPEIAKLLDEAFITILRVEIIEEAANMDISAAETYLDMIFKDGHNLPGLDNDRLGQYRELLKVIINETQRKRHANLSYGHIKIHQVPQ